MSEHDLRRGLDALADDQVRAKVAAGDVPAAGELDLTDEERDLLLGAADDEPEVIGHMISVGLGLSPTMKLDDQVQAITQNEQKGAMTATEPLAKHIQG